MKSDTEKAVKHYRHRSAITGRFVKLRTWLRWPRLTIRERRKGQR